VLIAPWRVTGASRPPLLAFEEALRGHLHQGPRRRLPPSRLASGRSPGYSAPSSLSCSCFGP